MNKRRAFTLVELLIVIGIILALVSILLPAMTSARHQAKSVTCLANLRQLQLAFVNYVGNDNDGHSIAYNGGQNLWLPELRSGGGVQAVRFCPEAPDIAPVMGTAVMSWTWAGSTSYPIGYTAGSYGINGWLYADDNHGGSPSSYVSLPKGWKSDLPVFSDSIWIDGWPHSGDAPPANVHAGGNNSSMARICMDRHHRAINVVFLGGNAATIPLLDLWSLPWSTNYVPPTPAQLLAIQNQIAAQ